MKAARLGRTPAHDKGASHAIQFPRAIRKTHLRCFPLLSQLTFAHTLALPLNISVGRFSCEHVICLLNIQVNWKLGIENFSQNTY